MVTDREISEIILEARLHDPDLPHRLAESRETVPRWDNRRLVLVAADHPARRTVAAGADPWAMANRPDLLRRLVRVLMQPFVDGILATPDIMEELWILQSWVVSQGGPDFLAKKLLIGSMNRAGLADTVFDLDDFVTAYSADSLLAHHLDAGKLLLRIDPKDAASSRTLKYVAEALKSLDAAHIPVFLEPISIPLTTDELVRLIGVASALGPSSRRRWLKVPMVTPFSRISQATTCPLVLLGGADPGSSERLLSRVAHCLQEGPNVRGILMGRGVFFPTDGEDSRVLLAKLASQLHQTPIEEVVEWDRL